MICSSVNLDRFILSVLRWADSSYSWRSFRGSRHKEKKIADAIARQPERWLELAELDARLADTEAEVLASVPTIRANVERVKWPRSLSSFETVAARYRDHLARELAENDRRRTAYHARLDAQAERDNARYRADLEKIMGDLAASLAKAVKSGEMSKEAALTFIRDFGKG